MGVALIPYLTTDPQALGILAWISTAITLLGFAVATWQIVKVKRAAEAARRAALGLAARVRSRELLALLSSAHNHVEAARNRAAPRSTVDWDTFCHWALAGKGEGNGPGVMLLFVVRLLAPNRMR